ncbi:MAG: hypothetical protein JW976_03890 [Syntrophaceae bacterium]|nr:hypothetical protein [Syntrophaceae bacterium]
MKKSSLFDDYLRNYSVGDRWKLIANDTDDVSQVVVIPAYAEKDMLFPTLASLAKNPPSSLENSLIICVINNKNNSTAAVKENNWRTIEFLNALVGKKSLKTFEKEKELYKLLIDISDAKMKLGYVNASSKGYEIPLNAGGVGMARKIGMDTALRLLKNSSAQRNVIISLDADTLVQSNYLSAIKNYFAEKVKTAIVAYEHQMPVDYMEKAAICCYEIFLRYWVLGLKYAKSPWAFHSIGSTISVSTEAYLEVRGMNRRGAGEDFYFLNKLAKVGKIDYIKETRVYPSARQSTRVPFGTGKRIGRFLTGFCEEEYCLYDPQIFSILGNWLRLMKEMVMERENDILVKAEIINPGLRSFLEESKFPLVWYKIRRVAKDEKSLERHFHDWFDGFRTLKMINYFTRKVYPPINMFLALEKIFTMFGLTGLKFNTGEKIPSLVEQMKIMNYLRTIT